MNNLESINGIFAEIFNVEASVLNAEFNNKTVEGWDSVRQLSLTAAIEETFDIFLDPEDIIGCSSYDGVIEILKKYGIQL